MSKTPVATPTPELEWVKLREELGAFDEYEPFMDKLKRVLVQHPLIPLGILATCGSLALGLRSMVRGDRKQSNIMMRYRVFFQAVTVAAMTISSVTIIRARQQSTEETKENST